MQPQSDRSGDPGRSSLRSVRPSLARLSRLDADIGVGVARWTPSQTPAAFAVFVCSMLFAVYLAVGVKSRRLLGMRALHASLAGDAEPHVSRFASHSSARDVSVHPLLGCLCHSSASKLGHMCGSGGESLASPVVCMTDWAQEDHRKEFCRLAARLRRRLLRAAVAKRAIRVTSVYPE